MPKNAQTAIDRAESGESTRKLNAVYRGAVLSALTSPILLLLCVLRWAEPNPWSALNLFSGAFIVLVSFSHIEQATTFLRSAFRSRATLREAVGVAYDSWLVNFSVGLGFLEYAMLLEYAHFRIAPALVQRPLQWLGFFCAAGSIAMLLWADTWLTRHFASDESARNLMTDGPYRFVRHPRYVSIILNKLAAPLLLGSVLAWIALPVWIALVFRRIALEEAHVRKAFGSAYDVYAARTARLVPGIY